MSLSEDVIVPIKLGFLLVILGAIASGAIFIWTLRSDVIRLLNVVETQQNTIIEMRMDLRLTAQELTTFRAQYEKDMKRYIRE